MELYTSSTQLVSLLPTLLVCIISVLLIIRKVSQMRTCKRPPGPWGLPVLGHLHMFGKLPHRSLYELSKLHGPLMSLRIGSSPLIVASSPVMARQILQTHDLAFSNPMSYTATRSIFGVGKDILFSPPNAYWKLMRRIFATEIASNKGLHFFKPVRVEEVRALKRSVLADSMDANTTCDARPQEIRQKLQGVTRDIMMRMMVGKRFEELGRKRDVEGSKKASMTELIEEVLELLGMLNLGDFLPYIEWMDLQGCRRRSKRVVAGLRVFFEEIIQARRLANEDGTRPPNDYIDLLLQASASFNTPIHIMEVIMDFFVAGTDTIAITIEWALAELLSNPEKMRMVQAQIDEVVGRERVVEEEDIDELPYLVACVKETMRLHPAIPLVTSHKTGQACEIMGFHIPANTEAYVNTWAIGRDPKCWENPTKFAPERFLEASSVDLQGQHFELLPFGSGRRACPGSRFSLLSMHIILATLLQAFEWSIPPSHQLDMSDSFQLHLCLATPLVVYTTPRLPKQLY